jgi:hypothetical protein
MAGDRLGVGRGDGMALEDVMIHPPPWDDEIADVGYEE